MIVLHDRQCKTSEEGKEKDAVFVVHFRLPFLNKIWSLWPTIALVLGIESIFEGFTFLLLWGMESGSDLELNIHLELAFLSNKRPLKLQSAHLLVIVQRQPPGVFYIKVIKKRETLLKGASNTQSWTKSSRDKFTKLSKIGFSMECFTADFLQLFTKKC